MAGNKKNGEKGKKHVFDLLRGKEIVIQSKTGIMFEGTYGGFDRGLHILTNAKIIGKKHIAKVDFVTIHESLVHHINTKPTEIEPKLDDVREKLLVAYEHGLISKEKYEKYVKAIDTIYEMYNELGLKIQL